MTEPCPLCPEPAASLDHVVRCTAGTVAAIRADLDKIRSHPMAKVLGLSAPNGEPRGVPL